VKVTITGAAGFIGSHLVNLYLSSGYEVQGIDSLNDYYSVDLKRHRVKDTYQRFNADNFQFLETDSGSEFAEMKIKEFKPDIFIHLSAQAGVRQGLNGVISYSRNNIEAFLRVLKTVKEIQPRTFLYASSSSVYGENAHSPFSEREKGLRPRSIYGITKLANEMFVTATLSDIQTRSRGLRFFTVYGPSGRPDMAYFQAISSALFSSVFRKFGNGNISRDFTFISDVTNSVKKLEIELANRPEGYIDVVNVGGGRPVSVNEMLNYVEVITKEKVNIEQNPPSREDTTLTFSDTTTLASLIGPLEFVLLEDGLLETIKWFRKAGAENVLRWIS
jgi:UDP-glucuronate 4-epimerase